ncbi:MAG: TerB family tellurite resistance protein [Bacteroidales bacterium]|nr:TerB family tellurite resistance protein [Bacteroidales bacterium]
MAKKKRDLVDDIIDFAFKFADGTIRELAGYKYSAPAAGSKSFKSHYAASELPKKVDMRSKMTEVEDQMQVNSCTANAVAGAYEYLVKKNQGIDYDASRLFIYYNGRAAGMDRGERMKDDGSAIQLAVSEMIEKGCCSEHTWPYSENKSVVNRRPSSEAYEEAKSFKLKDTEYVPVDLQTWKSALAEGYPIIFGCTLFNSFDNMRRGRVPDPTRNDVGRGSHGNHAMLCVGYSDPDRMFIVRNSWGNSWGDNGYCYMSYDYLMNEDYNLGDCWIIKDADEVVDDHEEEWENDDESLFVDLDDEFSNMSDETWNEFNEQMGEYGFEYRIGTLFITAAAIDGELSDEEIEAAATHLKNILKLFKIKMNPKKIILHCIDIALNQDEFLEETLAIFKQYLSVGALANIYKQMLEVASSDGLDEEEEDFIDQIADIWFEDVDDWSEYAYEDDDFDDEDWDYDYDEDDEDYDEDDEDYDEDDEDYDEDDEDFDEDDEDFDEDDEDFDEDDEDFDEDDEDFDDDGEFDEDDEEFDEEEDEDE